MKLEIFAFPKSFSLSQGFAKNATATYNNAGLIGHTGKDYVAGWNTPIPCRAKGEVIGIMNKDNPDPNKYRGVRILVKVGEIYYEHVYGHMNEIWVKKGDIVGVGDFIGTMGNTGEVYSFGRLVTKQEKLNGSKAGTHVHFQQRPCKRVLKAENNKRYLLGDADGTLYLDNDAYYYECYLGDNGLASCEDPTPYEINVQASIVPELNRIQLEVAKLLAKVGIQK